MEGVYYTGTAISGLLYLFAGVRLLRLGMRTSEAPEYLLGAVFLLWSLFYYLDILPYLLVDESLLTPLFFLSRASTAVSTIVFALFNRRVFRSDEVWPGWIIAATTLCLVGGFGGSIAIGDWGGVRPLSSPWYWTEMLATLVPFFWLSAESLGQYRKARLRLRLNLCNPMVCNRYLLLGLAGVVWIAAEVVATVQSIEYQLTQGQSAPVDILLMTTELISLAIVWFAFFPPAAYRRWIQRTAPAVLLGES